mgnify:CR=1 FL=1
MSKKFLGAHVPAIGGVQNTPLVARSIGAEAFALFTKNQRRWEGAPLTEEGIGEFKENLASSGIPPEQVLPHNSYLINIGNPDPDKRGRSLESLKEEARRTAALGLSMINFHPGSHLGGMSDDECLSLIIRGMDEVLSEVPGVRLVLETTAGQGSSVGWRFEHLARLVSGSKDPDRVGVCLDTCHIFAAGYDLRTREAYEKTMAAFGAVIGFNRLRGVHMNDALSAFGSRVDRHASIGKGNIGMAAFGFLMQDPRFSGIPLILETPNHRLWKEEILMLRALEKGPVPEESPE